MPPALENHRFTGQFTEDQHLSREEGLINLIVFRFKIHHIFRSRIWRVRFKFWILEILNVKDKFVVSTESPIHPENAKYFSLNEMSCCIISFWKKVSKVQSHKSFHVTSLLRFSFILFYCNTSARIFSSFLFPTKEKKR